MVANINSSTSSARADALFTRIDSKNQGYIDQAELEAALSKNSKGNSAARAERLFGQLDSDKDGKVTKSELTTALDRVSDQLRSQLNQSRAARAGDAPPPPPPPPPPTDGTTGATDPADTDADGAVSEAEAAAYAAAQAGGTTTTATSTSSAKGLTLEQLTEQRDALPAGDTRRQAALGKLVDNFSAADADGDGKLTRNEGRDYLKANRPEGGRQDSGFDAFARALQALRAYADNDTTIPPPPPPVTDDTTAT